MIIYSLRPVSMLSDSAQRKTNQKSEMTQCQCTHHVLNKQNVQICIK